MEHTSLLLTVMWYAQLMEFTTTHGILVEKYQFTIGRKGNNMASLSRMATVCRNCDKRDTCDHKKMELCALAELPPQVSMNASQGVLMDSAMPLMRQRIESPLSPFVYKDELEKEIYKTLREPFSIGLNYGA